jgi:hypothetical protein
MTAQEEFWNWFIRNEPGLIFDPSELLFSWFACDAGGGMIYSYRSAITGSVRIARRAGT